jgi:Tol biopolymer transport system component
VVAHPASGSVDPAWSPDGTWIAYVRRARDRRAELRIVHPDGTGNRRITRVTERFGTLCWSPNGKTIALIGSALHLVNLRTHHTTNVRLPAGGRARSTNFTWAPTGDRVLYQALRRPSVE